MRTGKGEGEVRSSATPRSDGSIVPSGCEIGATLAQQCIAFFGSERGRRSFQLQRIRRTGAAFHTETICHVSFTALAPASKASSTMMMISQTQRPFALLSSSHRHRIGIAKQKRDPALKGNNDLVDLLVESTRLTMLKVQYAFRLIDRAFFLISSLTNESVYSDKPLKQALSTGSRTFIHQSTPSIYSRVAEALELQPGGAFLLLGSGSGYFSAIVGVLLGADSINHGVEWDRAVQEFAQRQHKLLAVREDLRDFTPAKFFHGNAYCLHTNMNDFYDNVYIGAAIDESRLPRFQSLLRLGGVLIVPVGNQLLKIRRMGMSKFTRSALLAVEFAELVGLNEKSTPVRLSPADERPVKVIVQ